MKFYEIGNRNLQEINTDVLKQITEAIGRDGTEVKVNQDKAQQLLDLMLSDKDYASKISDGAEIALRWKIL